MKKLIGGAAVVIVGVLAMAGPAFADHCTNASRNAHAPGAGAQLIIDTNTGEIVWATPGVLKRVAAGLIDPDTGDGFHGMVGLDFDGDGAADLTTYIVGPHDAIPENAQHNGPPCRGATSIEAYLSECM